MNSKHCPYCHCNTGVVKIGKTSSNRQRYRCRKCSKTWVSKPHPEVLAKHIWYDFIFHDLNYAELAKLYHLSKRSIRRKLDSYKAPAIIPSAARVIAMDVTYFGRSWGILTVINAENGKVLYCEPTLGYEMVSDYERAIRYLHHYGVYPQVAIVDGKKGVIRMLESYGIRVQLCHFHQKQIITQCITRHPVLEPNKELQNIVSLLTHANKETFALQINDWYQRHESWLKERSYSENGRWTYSHKLTRRAIRSLRNNLPYLFTYEDYPELNIPKTNNKLEGIHSTLKRRLGNHRGLRKVQKIQFARIFFSERTEV